MGKHFDAAVAHQRAAERRIALAVADGDVGNRGVDQQIGLALPHEARRVAASALPIEERASSAPLLITATAPRQVAYACGAPEVVHHPHRAFSRGENAPDVAERYESLADPSQHNHIGLSDPRMAADAGAEASRRYRPQVGHAEAVVDEDFGPFGGFRRFVEPRGHAGHPRRVAVFARNEHAGVNAALAQCFHQPVGHRCGAPQCVVGAQKQNHVAKISNCRRNPEKMLYLSGRFPDRGIKNSSPHRAGKTDRRPFQVPTRICRLSLGSSAKRQQRAVEINYSQLGRPLRFIACRGFSGSVGIKALLWQLWLPDGG